MNAYEFAAAVLGTVYNGADPSAPVQVATSHPDTGDTLTEDVVKVDVVDGRIRVAGYLEEES